MLSRSCMLEGSWVLFRRTNDFKPRNFWSVDVTVEINAQAGLDGAAAGIAAGPDADVPDDLIAPAEVGRVIRIQQVVVLQRLPVPRVDDEIDFVEDGIGKERVRTEAHEQRAVTAWPSTPMPAAAENRRMTRDALHCRLSESCPRCDGVRTRIRA